MAVYFQKGSNWMDYAAPIVGQLLGYQLEKNKLKQANDVAQQQAAQEATLKAQDRENSINMLRRLGMLPEEGTSFDMRNNPNAAYGQMATAAYLLGHKFDQGDTVQNLNAPFTRATTDLGNRANLGLLNPSTGDVVDKELAYGLNPTDKYEADKRMEGIKYESDSELKRESIQQAGANKRSAATSSRGARAKQSLVQDEEGNYVYVSSDGRTIPTNVKGVPKAKVGEGKTRFRPTTLEDGSIGMIDTHTGEVSRTGFKGATKNNPDLLAGILGNPPDGTPVPVTPQPSYNPFGGFGKPKNPFGMNQKAYEKLRQKYSDEEIRLGLGQ